MIKYSLHINKSIWHVSFYINDINGKRKQKQLSTGVKALNSNGKQIVGSKKKADEIAQEKVAEYEGIKESNCRKWTLDKYVSDWIERDKVYISITTYDKYISMLNKHITPYFSRLGLSIKEIKPIHLERYCTEKINEGLSPTTVNKHIGIIRPALTDAMKNGYIRSNPAEIMTKPKKAKTKPNYYNQEQLRKLLQIAKNTTIEIPIYLAVFFGLRRSEAIGLTWSAINLNKKTMTICQKAVTGMVEGKTQTVIDKTLKTEASERTFLLDDAMCKYLTAVKTEQENYIRETNEYKDYVCVNEFGNLLKPDYITAKFRKLLKANNMPSIRFHDLRHSCLSLLANNSNFTMKQIQDYAGHSNFLTTANTYSHTDISVKKMELSSITENFKDILVG